MIYLSDKQLALRYGVSRPTIWRWVKEGDLPSPIKLGPGSTRWKLSEVEDWEKKRQAEAG